LTSTPRVLYHIRHSGLLVIVKVFGEEDPGLKNVWGLI
jgi:hypothetical protein